MKVEAESRSCSAASRQEDEVEPESNGGLDGVGAQACGAKPSFDYEEPAREDERKRIARELHDSTSQSLVVLQLQLRRLEDLNLPSAQRPIDELRQTIAAIREVIRKIGEAEA